MIDTITISPSFVKVVAALGDAERGRLFTAMCEYALTGAEPELRGNERFLFPSAKMMIDECRADSSESTPKKQGSTPKKHTISNNNTNNNKTLESSSNLNTNSRSLTEYTPEFEHFWIEYPKDRRVDKKEAFAAWKKINPDEELIDTIVASVREWSTSEQWQDPSYIPHPTTWLNRRRWESHPPQNRQKNAGLRYEQKPISESDWNNMVVNFEEDAE